MNVVKQISGVLCQECSIVAAIYSNSASKSNVENLWNIFLVKIALDCWPVATKCKLLGQPRGFIPGTAQENSVLTKPI